MSRTHDTRTRGSSSYRMLRCRNSTMTVTSTPAATKPFAIFVTLRFTPAGPESCRTSMTTFRRCCRARRIRVAAPLMRRKTDRAGSDAPEVALAAPVSLAGAGLVLTATILPGITTHSGERRGDPDRMSHDASAGLPNLDLLALMGCSGSAASNRSRDQMSRGGWDEPRQRRRNGGGGPRTPTGVRILRLLFKRPLPPLSRHLSAPGVLGSSSRAPTRSMPSRSTPEGARYRQAQLPQGRPTTPKEPVVHVRR